MGTEFLFRRCRDQEGTITRLTSEAQLLRDENADLLAQLDAARGPTVIADGTDRLEATPPVGPAAPATARAAPRRALLVANGADRLEATLPIGPAAPAIACATLTRWLAGHVPLEVVESAQLLASALITSRVLQPDSSDEDLLRLAVQIRDDAMRVEVREPGTGGVVATSKPDRECSGDIGLQLVDMVPTRWGVSREAGTNVWFEFHAPGATG